MDPIRGKYLYLWYDHDSALAAAVRCAHDRETVLERLTWLLLEHLDAHLFAEVFEKERLYITAPGKPACLIPRFEAGAVTVRVGRDIAVHADDFQAFAEATVVPTKEDALIRVGRFVMQQNQETDDFKRFMWCYAGLESAATSLYRRLKTGAKQALRFSALDGNVLDGLAVTELVYPDNEAPEARRSILFRFAMMALSISPQTANQDVEIFKGLNAYRNGIHGTVDLSSRPPVAQAVDLFNRYYAVVRAHLKA